MTFRVFVGVVAAVPLTAALAGIAPADAVVLCEGKQVTIEWASTPAATTGDDVILGTSGADTINGLGGNDTICGNGGGDTIKGGAGNDVILPGTGNDSVKGGDGIDTVSYSDAPAGIEINLGVKVDQATVGSGSDTLLDEFENLTGSPFNDYLVDSIGPNRVKALAGDDDILTQRGTDTLKAGDGDDTLTFAGASKGITFDLEVKTAQTTGSGVKTVAGVENVDGTLYADVIRGDDGPNVLGGQEGNDLLIGRGGADHLYGEADSDTLRGGLGNDTCDGGPPSTDTASGCEASLNIP